jgi:hypothetical protein
LDLSHSIISLLSFLNFINKIRSYHKRGKRPILDHGEVELPKIFTKCVDSRLGTQEIAMCLLALCIGNHIFFERKIGNHIGLAGMIMNFQFIIFDQFKLSSLPLVKFRLGEYLRLLRSV